MRAVDSKQTSEVDVFHTVYQLRRDRRYMVQTRAQYEFVYRLFTH
jgi:protein tyrosine phosphatase